MKRLREELKQAKEEHRQKENKWMASQTKVQEKIRTLEIRNRELSENLEKVRAEEQSLRRRLNASLRPGALVFLSNSIFMICLLFLKQYSIKGEKFKKRKISSYGTTSNGAGNTSSESTRCFGYSYRNCP